MGEAKWKDTELKLLATVNRDYSVDNTVDVTDNIWKTCLDNFEAVLIKFKRN